MINGKPHVVHAFRDYRVVFLTKSDDQYRKFERRAILEHRAGLDAMGGETWHEVCDISRDAESQTVPVEVPDDRGEAGVIVDLLHALVIVLAAEAARGERR